MEMKQHQIKEMIYTYLPEIIQQDREVRNFIISITKERYADKDRSEDRFDRMFDELKSLRIDQQLKWEQGRKDLKDFQLKQDKKWDDNQKKWDELQQERNKKWDELQQERDKKWNELQQERDKKWENFQQTQDEKWEKNAAQLDKMHKDTKRLERSIGAIGARWGMKSEASFRNALAGILETSFDIQVLNVNEYDYEGKVFGHPDQVELDIIIKNGLLIVCELKSSMSKSDIYIFDRKVEFYANKHNRKVSRKIVVSPMVNPDVGAVAAKLNVEVFSDSLDVKTL